MFILRYRTSKALLLISAMALIGSNCDAGKDGPNGGKEAWSGADAPADAALFVDQSEESETKGAVDASTDLAKADAPSDGTPPAGERIGTSIHVSRLQAKYRRPAQGVSSCIKWVIWARMPIT